MFLRVICEFLRIILYFPSLQSGGHAVPKRNRFDHREMKMTWSILIVFLCYILCAAPISTLVFLNQKTSYFWILFTGLYLSLFILNFFVYSQQNEQYQKAFLDYLNMIKYFLTNGTMNGYRSKRDKQSFKFSSERSRRFNNDNSTIRFWMDLCDYIYKSNKVNIYVQEFSNNAKYLIHMETL